MLNFGKYKGKKLKKVFLYDKQYVLWCINNVPDFKLKLDEEDSTFLEFFFNPFKDIDAKKKNFDELKDILKKRGILYEYYYYTQYGEYGGEECVIETNTVYGYKKSYGSVDRFYYESEKDIFINTITDFVEKYKYYKNDTEINN